VLAALVIGAITGTIVEMVSLSRNVWLVMALTVLVSASLVSMASLRVLPQLDPLISARPIARQIYKILPPGAALYTAGDINRNCDYGLRFYLDQNAFPQFDPRNSQARYAILSSGGDMALDNLGIIHRKIVAKFLPYCWVESLPMSGASRGK